MHLSDYMAANGLSDEDVAKAINVDRSTISRLRRGETRPSWESSGKIKRFTNGEVTADDFIEAKS